jgi:hypothetical protein
MLAGTPTTVVAKKSLRHVGQEVARTESLETHSKKSRRRHIDPTTCEREYGPEEIEFMRAIDDYKRKSGRMFPTCSEVLEVIRSLGYVRLSEEDRERLESRWDEVDTVLVLDDELELS